MKQFVLFGGNVYYACGGWLDLHHCDLQVTVTDEDAVFYKRGQSRSLDYRPQTLGINVNCSYQEHKGDK